MYTAITITFYYRLRRKNVFPCDYILLVSVLPKQVLIIPLRMSYDIISGICNEGLSYSSLTEK